MAYKGKEWDDRVIKISEESKSATEAASKLGIKYSTYRKHAKRLGVFKTNQSGKGFTKNKPDYMKTNFDEVLNGNCPKIQTGAIKRFLFKSGIKQNKCEICGLTEWLGMEISCHLDHINGNCHDHRLENLRILCPNCHSQTETYCGKSRKKTKQNK